MLTVDRLFLREARLLVGSGSGQAIPSDWAHDRGVHGDLGTLPNGDPLPWRSGVGHPEFTACSQRNSVRTNDSDGLMFWPWIQ